MNLTKLNLSKKISDELQMSIEDSKLLVNKLFDIKKNFLKIRDLKISKFGSFIKRTSPKRIGRNPKTLEVHIIPKKLRVSFKPSKIVKDILN